MPLLLEQLEQKRKNGGAVQFLPLHPHFFTPDLKSCLKTLEQLSKGDGSYLGCKSEWILFKHSFFLMQNVFEQQHQAVTCLFLCVYVPVREKALNVSEPRSWPSVSILRWL